MSDQSDIENEEAVKQQKKRNSYSIERKLEIIKYSDISGKHAAAKKFNVHRKRIQEWKAQEEKLRKFFDIFPYRYFFDISYPGLPTLF